MKQYIKVHPWKIIEEGLNAENNEITESLTSLGNGMIGQRGNFEEGYGGKTLQGSYVAGIYYPDKTRVGWWKNGYPEYFAKVLNTVNWTSVRILINDHLLDLHTTKHSSFVRCLDMQQGILQRSFRIHIDDAILEFQFERFCDMSNKESSWIKINISSKGFSGKITIEPILDFDVRNKDSNYDEQFWQHFQSDEIDGILSVSASTKKTDFKVCAAMISDCTLNGSKVSQLQTTYAKAINENYELDVHDKDHIELTKRALITSDFHHGTNIELNQKARTLITDGLSYNQSKTNHVNAWSDIWSNSDIVINGDDSAQQAIRFNIFHLYQTYTGEDPRLNIGPKGFTGEKYGGSTYWDTEAYCLPFYLLTADLSIAKNLLIYRHNHLDRAIENAEKLGFTNGAALYPMVTMNGEECHNEWEITFEEIHRNGAIAYAIYDYIRYSGDDTYIQEYGLEVLVGIARFWAQRVNWSQAKDAYVMLGVTGPNEYENNVNNNWYTNLIARWCLQYALDCYDQSPDHQTVKVSQDEQEKWKDIINKIYLPEDKQLGIFLQQDGFLDKEIIPIKELPKEHQPLNQNWSWDRILRSCYIKQADILQGLYFFEEQFDINTIRRNFDFYEPITVHESSLSPCVHSILACRLDKSDKAYEMYLRTARLDIDDYNNDTEDGLHITSMAGTWMSIVKGFGGVGIKDDKLCFDPKIPKEWKSLAFKIKFRGHDIYCKASAKGVSLENASGKTIDVLIQDKPQQIGAFSHIYKEF